jgi:Protein of unknown function (DUF3617)
MRPIRSAFLIALASMLGAVAWAEGPLVEPGEWEFTSTTNAPLLPEPLVQTEKRCIEDAEFDPLKLVVINYGCKVTERSLSGQVLDWQMECPNTLGLQPFEGEGKLTSSGRTLEGHSTMEAHVEDSVIEVETRWKARRVGDCERE